MPSEPVRPRRRGRGARSSSAGTAPGRSATGRGPAGPRTGVARSPSQAGPRSPGARPDSTRTPSAGPTVSAEIRLSRAQRLAATTSGMLGVSSTRRAAVLALVVCALALSVAVPLRNFLGQRQELSRLQAEQRRLTVQVAQLDQERARLADPAAIADEARARLGYARPGEIPFVVQLPNDPTTVRRVVDPSAGRPWFETLWRDVRGVPR